MIVSFVPCSPTAHLCVIPQPPVNGNLSCEESDVGILCRIHCNDGFAFALPSSEEYFCDYEEGRWMPESMFPFPDCAGKFVHFYRVRLLTFQKE